MYLWRADLDHTKPAYGIYSEPYVNWTTIGRALMDKHPLNGTGGARGEGEHNCFNFRMAMPARLL